MLDEEREQSGGVWSPAVVETPLMVLSSLSAPTPSLDSPCSTVSDLLNREVRTLYVPLVMDEIPPIVFPNTAFMSAAYGIECMHCTVSCIAGAGQLTLLCSEWEFRELE